VLHLSWWHSATCLGFRVQGLGFRVQGSGFRDKVSPLLVAWRDLCNSSESQTGFQIPQTACRGRGGGLEARRVRMQSYTSPRTGSFNSSPHPTLHCFLPNSENSSARHMPMSVKLRHPPGYERRLADPRRPRDDERLR